MDNRYLFAHNVRNSHDMRRAQTAALTTLPVLEAASRLGSCSLAADELHVTHGAISHQIRSLEEYLGISLFARIGRRVELTPEGAALADKVREALQQVATAVDAISPAARENKLVISVLPSFASRWLMPRLGRFLEAHPEYQVSVEANQARANFLIDGVDVAIRYGTGPWPGLYSQYLAGDTYFPVCSPKFRRGRLPKKPEHLKGLPLFRLEPGYWEKWFAAAGMDYSPPLLGVEYNDAALFLQQAIAGEGIALTRRSLVETDLANGQLVKLFDVEVPTQNQYHLVCLQHHANSRKIVAFRDWLIAQIDWQQPE